MKTIQLSQFRRNPDQVDNLQEVEIFVPYGENDASLKAELLEKGFNYISLKFVDRELMDTIQYFRK